MELIQWLEHPDGFDPQWNSEAPSHILLVAEDTSSLPSNPYPENRLYHTQSINATTKTLQFVWGVAVLGDVLSHYLRALYYEMLLRSLRGTWHESGVALEASLQAYSRLATKKLHSYPNFFISGSLCQGWGSVRNCWTWRVLRGRENCYTI